MTENISSKRNKIKTMGIVLIKIESKSGLPIIFVKQQSSRKAHYLLNFRGLKGKKALERKFENIVKVIRAIGECLGSR